MDSTTPTPKATPARITHNILQAAKALSELFDLAVTE